MDKAFVRINKEVIVMHSKFHLLKQFEFNDSVCELYKHSSGAELIYINNNDVNRVFSVSFKTPPQNDNGIPHILEHCTLCGSNRFPLKDTFNELASTSLYTYLNAMTFKDKTVFPVCSLYEDEFSKLVDVYLDSVFKPLLREETFLHEAWHYDESKESKVNGVVYSEMHSAFSNPSREIRSFIHKKLFPDNCYQYESSGYPNEILNSTHDELISFHKTHYQPANSYMFLYGDIELEKYMTKIDSYLSRHIGHNIMINEQENLKERVIANGTYMFTGSQKKFFAAGYVIGKTFDDELMLSMQILNHYLSRTAAAPLKKFLPLVKTSLESDILQPVYSISCENFNGSTEKFMEVITKIFEQLSRNKLDKVILTSCVNNLEFELRAATHKYRPPGLVMNLLMLTDWIHGGDPFNKLNRFETLRTIRNKLDTDFFSDIMQKYILENKHVVFTSLTPVKKDISYTVSKNDVEKAKLVDEFINAPDTNTNAIPLANIPLEIKFDKTIERSTDAIKILHTNIDTDKIIYIDFMFDTSCVPENLLSYIGILCETLTYASVKKNSSLNMQALMNNISNIKIVFDTFGNGKGMFKPMLNIKIKTLASGLDEVFNFLSGIFSSVYFDDEQLIKKIIVQRAYALNNSYLSSACDASVSRASSYKINEYRYRESVKGITFYNFIKNILKEYDGANVAKNLLTVYSDIVLKDNLTVHITSDEEDFQIANQKIKTVFQKINDETKSVVVYKFDKAEQNEAFYTLATINSNAFIVDLNGYTASGTDYVFETFMNKNYLMQTIRLQGGAYDSGCRFKNNTVSFYSSADSNVSATYEKFIGAADFILNYEFTQRDLQKYIISAFNNLFKINSVEQRAEMSLRRFFGERSNFKRTCDEIRETSANDLLVLATKINIDSAMICTLGERNILQAEASLFESTTKL